MLRPTAKHFLVTRTLPNAHVAQALNYRVQGFDHVNARRYPMQPGDLLAVDVTHPISGFIATVVIEGEHFEDASIIWQGREPDERFPHRHPAKARCVVNPENAVPARHLISRLQLARHLRSENRWGMLFRNAVREIPENDFRLIENALRQAASLG